MSRKINRKSLSRTLSRLGGALLLTAALPLWASGCPTVMSGQPFPLGGLWEVNSYSEIEGNKAYTSPGDLLLVKPTATPGQVCVEFTRYVEDSYYYYLAIDASGSLIDDVVPTADGGSLKILIQRAGEGIAMALVHQPGAQTAGGAESEAGGLVGGGRP